MYFSPPKQCHSCPQVVSGIAAQFFGADLQSQAHPRQEGCPFKARLTQVEWLMLMWHQCEISPCVYRPLKEEKKTLYQYKSIQIPEKVVKPKIIEILYNSVT